MINSSSNNGGIYRSYIIDLNSDIRIYTPGLITNVECPINNDGTLNTDIFLRNKNSYPTPLWCVPNIEATRHEQVHPCWVVFENGDITRPIIMGFLGNGIKYTVVNPQPANTSSSEDSSGDNANNDNSTNTNSTNANGWLSDVSGSAAKEHGSGSGTQCVELVNDYVQNACGIVNNGFGDGKEYTGNLIAQYPNSFSSVSSNNLQAGDIISLRGSQPQWGHAAVVKSVNGTKVTIVEQWNGSGTVRTSTFDINDGGNRTILGAARPK